MLIPVGHIVRKSFSVMVSSVFSFNSAVKYLADLIRREFEDSKESKFSLLLRSGLPANVINERREFCESFRSEGEDAKGLVSVLEEALRNRCVSSPQEPNGLYVDFELQSAMSMEVFLEYDGIEGEGVERGSKGTPTFAESGRVQGELDLGESLSK